MWTNVIIVYELLTNAQSRISSHCSTKLTKCPSTVTDTVQKNESGSLGGPFPTVEYYYIFRIQYTEAILSNSTRKLLWFEITKMLMAV